VFRNFSVAEELTKELRVAQFNILANGLSAKRPDLGGFKNADMAFLNWSYRKKLIIQEIARANSHFIGMQEVDEFEDLSRELSKLGYEGSFIPKVNSPCLEFSENPDGCAIFYKSTRFKIKNPESESFRIGDDNQVAAVLVLEDKENPGESYTVCAAHLKATKDDAGESIRLKQVQVVMEKVKSTAAKYSCRASFLCVDLNGIPSGEAYLKGSTVMNSSMPLLMEGKEPPFTTFKKRGEHETRHTIDYIFFETYMEGLDLKPGRYLKIPQDIEPSPNWTYPSDHYMICVAFKKI